MKFKRSVAFCLGNSISTSSSEPPELSSESYFWSSGSLIGSSSIGSYGRFRVGTFFSRLLVLMFSTIALFPEIQIFAYESYAIFNFRDSVRCYIVPEKVGGHTGLVEVWGYIGLVEVRCYIGLGR